MKKLLMTIILVAATIFLFTGCSKKDDLSACDEKRKEIEEKYGITICYGNDSIEDANISKLELCVDENKVDTILDEVDDYFSKLPEGFLEELTAMIENEKTNVCVVISVGNYMGVSFETKGTEYWVINENGVIAQLAENNMRSIIYHIRYSGGVVNFMPEWKTYNPEGFVYGENDENRKYLYGVAENDECYFIVEETLENVVDEMQALFSLMWDEITYKLYDMVELPKIDAKLKYLCSELDRVFETVDENAYWARYIK